jgi:hypothetical protein
MHQRSFLWALPLATIIGCGGAPPPQDLITDVTATMRAAEEAGAAQEPKAQLHLKKASEQLEKGKALAADEDERASLVLRRAEADADLALALAQERTAKEEAETQTEKVNKLKGKVK